MNFLQNKLGTQSLIKVNMQTFLSTNRNTGPSLKDSKAA